MISVICGAKGSGKTKKIIDAANDTKTDGNTVYITDRADHSRQIKPFIRFVDAAEYRVNNAEALLGFIKGILASNNDITDVFIDGFARIAGMEIPAMEECYTVLEQLSKQDRVKFILTVSTDAPPAWMSKYI